jgi:AraC-like DNA-binding protein
VETFTAGSFRLFRVRYRAGMAVGQHLHAAPQIGVVTRGFLVEQSAGGCDSIAPGRALLRPAARQHANRFESDTEVLVIEPPGDRWNTLAGLLPTGTPVASCALAEGRLVHRRVVACLRGEPFAGVGLEAAMLEVIGAVGRALVADRALGLATSARSRLAADPSVSTAELAGALGVGLSELRAAFRQAFGTALESHRTELRLACAEELLRDSSASIARIAADLGFYDQAHLARAFRRRRGCAPSRLRASGPSRSSRT